MKALVALVAALVAVFSVTPAFAAEEKHPAHSSLPPAFEHLKSLVGTWQGVGPGMGPSSSTTFEIVANGSAIMERLAVSDSPMINVYHPDGDAVVMTHYCGAGNQPRLRCTKDGSSLSFTMADITNWKKGEAKMSAVTLVLVDADHMKQEWTSESDGKSESFTMDFERKK